MIKRIATFALLAVTAAFAAACGGAATNGNNSNTNSNRMANLTPPNINSTPVTVPNINVAVPGAVNGNNAPNANLNRVGAQTKGVEEKMRIMRESGNTAVKPSAPRDVVAPPSTPKKP